MALYNGYYRLGITGVFMPDTQSDLLISALQGISEKTKCLSSEVIVTFSKKGQIFLRLLSDENAAPNDIYRQSSLFCGEVFNEKSGKNLEDQDENTLALWVVGTLINELFDTEKMKTPDLFFAQKEKILELLEKVPFYAKAPEAPLPVVSIPVEVVQLVEEKASIPEITKPQEKIEPIVAPVSVPVKESIADRLEKIRAEITEKAKSLDITKIKAELAEKMKLIPLDKINNMKNDIEEKAKAGFSVIKSFFRKN